MTRLLGLGTTTEGEFTMAPSDLLKQAFSTMDAQEADRLGEVISDSVRFEFKPMGLTFNSLAEVRGLADGFYTAFPDLKHTITQVFDNGEWVAAQYYWTGTHTGILNTPDGQQIEPTNNKVRIEGCTVGRVQNGKIVEWSGYFDNMAFMAQLGLLPQPATV